MKNKRKLLGLTATASLLSLSAVLSSCGEVKKYTVTFKNGSETVCEQPVEDGYNATVPTAPTSGDLEFNGWYKDSALTTPFDFGSVITEDTTVYANWVNKYTVTFEAGTGATAVQAKTVREGGNVAVPTAPTKAGRVFNGWYKDAEYTTPFDFGSVITKNTTVYAKWEKAEYNVNLYMPDGSLFKTVGVKDGELLEVGENPTIQYQTFAGWFTDPSCSEDAIFDVEFDTVSENTNLYAKFEAKVEEVTYTFDYESMIAKYGAGTKSTQLEKFGGFYLENGAYAENSKKNYVSGAANDPDVNNQQKSMWFTSVSSGVLSFDWYHRSGSATTVMVYEIDAVEDNTVVPTVTEADEIYNKNDGNGVHVELNISEGKTYVIKSVGSTQFQQLKYTNTVGASKPAAIDATGALSSFLVGDTFVSTGLGVTLAYENGRTETVAAKDITVDTSAVDMTKEGTYTVTVNYTATDEYGSYPLSDTYEINVYKVDTIQAYTYSLNSSRETVYNKLVYAKNDKLLTGSIYVHAFGEMGEGDAKVTFDDQLASSEWELDGTVDMATVGRKTVTLQFKKDPTVKTTFEIEVVEKKFDKTTKLAAVSVDASVEAATLNGSVYTFKSITEALQYLQLCEVPADATKVITLKSGTYNEKVYIDMPNVVLMADGYTGVNQSSVGAGANCPVITFDKMNGLKAPNGTQYSTDGAATFTISKNATNCTVAGIKIMNYYNTNALYQESLKITKDSQATACLVRGDMASFFNVTLSGYHDTLYADTGRQYYYNCDIEGRTDFIFGDSATAYFDNCTIRTIGAGLTEKNGGYVVATKGKSGMNYGYIFNGCTFTADANVQAGCVSIARGWDVNMKVMVMNCTLGAHFSKGTYGQNYYEKTVTSSEFADLLAIGLYTYNAETSKYSKLASDATFDADAKYYVQLNDRYTKMNAAPTPTLLFEYNNEGNGAIQYSAEAAAKYATATFTLLNPADTATQAAMAKYEDLNTVFKADNGAVKYAENWNPYVAINQELRATVTVEGMDSTNSTAENYKLTLTNTYVGNTLVESQITAMKAAVKKALNDGYSLVNLYTDAEFKNELTTATVLTTNTKVYARIVEGTLEVVELADYTGVNKLATTEGVNKDTEWTATAEKDGSEYISSIIGSDVLGAASDDNTYSVYDRTPSQTTLTSPKTTESVKELTVVIYGGTKSSSNSMQVEIKAYDAEGNVLTTVTGYTPGNKKSGYVTTDPDADHTKEEKITLKSTTGDISYYTVKLLNKKADGGDASSKQFTFASIKSSYEKIVKNAYKIETKTYNLTFGNYSADTATTNGVLDGTGNEWLTVNGTDNKWKSGSPSKQFELGKTINGSYLKFTVAGTGKLELSIRSNSGTNECHAGVSSTDPTATAGPTWIKGATASSTSATETTDGDWVTTDSANATTITYTLEAGTYYIANGFTRAVRITGIKLTDKVQTPITQATTTTSTLTFANLDTSKITFDSSNKVSAEYTVAATDSTPEYKITVGCKVEPTQAFTGITEKGCINTQGTKKGVKVQLSAGAKVKVYFAASGDNTGRTIVLTNAADNSKQITGTVGADAGQNVIVTDELTVTEAGEYIIGSSNGLRIAKIEITQ